MPPIPKHRPNPEPIREPESIDWMLAEWQEFSREAAWKRSKRGNLWRPWEGLTLTIFGRDDGFYGWCIAGRDDEREFSRGSYETEDDAMEAIHDALEGWD